MNLKRLFLNEKFYTPTTIVQFRWINHDCPKGHVKMLKHSWDALVVQHLIQELLEQDRIPMSDFRTENYYQDREKNWWISNEGHSGGHHVVDSLSYVVNQERPVMTINIQKRDPLPTIQIPNGQNLQKYYALKRYHLTFELSDQLTLHVTIPLVEKHTEQTPLPSYQVWLESPIMIQEGEYELITRWTHRIYHMLTVSTSIHSSFSADQKIELEDKVMSSLT